VFIVFKFCGDSIILLKSVFSYDVMDRFASSIIFPKEKPEKRKQIISAGKAENQKETE